MPCRLCIHLAFTYSVGPSSVALKRTWTGSAFSTNESAWTGMLTGSQSRVWSGPRVSEYYANLGVGPTIHGVKSGQPMEYSLSPADESHTMATPICQAKYTSSTYSLEIQGWDFNWLKLLVARLPPFVQPSKILALYFQRICRAGVFGDWSCWGFWCGPAIIHFTS